MYCLWVLAEVAIAATDLAEIIGSAVALNLLFNIPLYAGVIITAVDVLFIIAFGMKNFRVLEVRHPVLYIWLHSCFMPCSLHNNQVLASMSAYGRREMVSFPLLM